MEDDRNKIIEQLMEEELERLKKDNNGRYEICIWSRRIFTRQ